jgi:hypothetical protein
MTLAHALVLLYGIAVAGLFFILGSTRDPSWRRFIILSIMLAAALFCVGPLVPSAPAGAGPSPVERERLAAYVAEYHRLSASAMDADGAGWPRRGLFWVHLSALGKATRTCADTGACEPVRAHLLLCEDDEARFREWQKSVRSAGVIQTQRGALKQAGLRRGDVVTGPGGSELRVTGSRPGRPATLVAPDRSQYELRPGRPASGPTAVKAGTARPGKR